MKKKNRWLIALAAVGIHICIGSVYAWSVLTKPVMAAMGLSLSETTWAFSIAILFLGLSAGFLGGVVERMGRPGPVWYRQLSSAPAFWARRWLSMSIRRCSFIFFTA